MLITHNHMVMLSFRGGLKVSPSVRLDSPLNFPIGGNCCVRELTGLIDRVYPSVLLHPLHASDA